MGVRTSMTSMTIACGWDHWRLAWHPHNWKPSSQQSPCHPRFRKQSARELTAGSCDHIPLTQAACLDILNVYCFCGERRDGKANCNKIIMHFFSCITVFLCACAVWVCTVLTAQFVLLIHNQLKSRKCMQLTILLWSQYSSCIHV